MNSKIWASAVLCAISGTAFAGGLDRTMTPIDILFQEGHYAEVSYGHVNPSVSGRDLTGTKTKGVANSFDIVTGGVKTQINDKMSLAIFYDQPYGSGIEYADNSPLLGDTEAHSDSDALTILFRYKFNENYSIHGGPRWVRADGRVDLRGLGYGRADGYSARFKSDRGIGVVAGAAYERPDIALRVALTYHSRTTLRFDTTETLPSTLTGAPIRLKLETGDTKSRTPQSVTLDFQTGIAQNTLIFGSVRWSEWSDFQLAPSILGTSLVNLNDNWNFELGVARKFTDKFAASLTLMYDYVTGDDEVSPLAPTDGYFGVGVGGKYNINDHLSVSAGIRYLWFGDAHATVRGNRLADFKNNESFGLGMKVGYTF